MNTRYLLALVSVADHGGIAAAARRLNLAPATVTEQLQTLERELSASLVARRGRTVALTSAGAAVAAAARPLLSQLAELAQIAQLDVPRGDLVIGSISTAMISVLPRAIRRLRVDAPEVNLRILPGTCEQLIQMLKDREIDGALIVRPPWEIPKAWSWQFLCQEPLQLIGAAGENVEDVRRALSTHPFIRMDRLSWTGRIVTQFLSDQNISMQEAFELDGLEAIEMLVAGGMGVALVPAWAAVSNSVVRQRLKTITIADPAYAREIGLLGERGPKQFLLGALWRAMRSG